MTTDRDYFAPMLAFVAASSLSLVITLGIGLQLVPDVGNIVAARFGLYPSPVGTALGDAAGIGGLSLAQALAVGGIVFLIVRERPPVLAVLGGLPVLWWLAPLGVHVLGVLLLVIGLVYGRTWALGLAGLVHLGALPVAVAQLVRSHWRLAAVFFGAGILGLILTDYGAALRAGSLGWRECAYGALCGLATVALGFGPALATGGSLRPLVAFAVATFGLTAFSTAGDFTRPNEPSLGLVLFAATRYALPLTVCAVLLAARCPDGRRDGLRLSHPGGSIT